MSKENKNDEVKFIDVPVQALGKYKNKNFVSLDNIKYNEKNGNLSARLGDDKIFLLKKHFQKKYMKIEVADAEKIEKSVMKTPKFNEDQSIESTVRMKVIGESNGVTFVGPTGQINYSKSFKGIVANLDDKHVGIVDGATLSKLGIKIVPTHELKKNGISR